MENECRFQYDGLMFFAIALKAWFTIQRLPIRPASRHLGATVTSNSSAPILNKLLGKMVDAVETCTVTALDYHIDSLNTDSRRRTMDG